MNRLNLNAKATDILQALTAATKELASTETEDFDLGTLAKVVETVLHHLVSDPEFVGFWQHHQQRRQLRAAREASK